jgi:hypothetical protein
MIILLLALLIVLMAFLLAMYAKPTIEWTRPS